MKPGILSGLLITACLVALPGGAQTQPINNDGITVAPKLVVENGLQVTATHTRAAAGQCTRVWVVVSGRVRGTYDRGHGFDGLWLSVWDDGLNKGAKWFAIPISSDFHDFVAVLGYEKIFGVDRDPGITINAGWADGDGSAHQQKDLVPDEVPGSCNDPFDPPVQPVLPWAEILPPGANPDPDQPNIPFTPIQPAEPDARVAPIPTLSLASILLLGAGIAAAAGIRRRCKKGS